jgi:hypothetical protein
MAEIDPLVLERRISGQWRCPISRPRREGVNSGQAMIGSVGVSRAAKETWNLIVNGEEALRLSG